MSGGAAGAPAAGASVAGALAAGPSVAAAGASDRAAGAGVAAGPGPLTGWPIGVNERVPLDTCIACGFCLPACPTYALTLDERASPRGRIAMMRGVDEGRLDPMDPTVREQSSFCLGCRACESVCPAGVPYGQLLERWRDVTWQGRHAPPLAVGLRFGVRRTRALRLAGRVRRAAPAHRGTRGDGLHLMLGCVERVLFPGVSRAVTRLLPGIDVPGDQGCCGALHGHNGASEEGAEMARELGRRLPGTILTTAGGCAAHLADVLGRERVRELSDYLVEAWADPGALDVPSLAKVRLDGRVARVGLQDSCQARNALGIVAQPRALLARVADYVELPSSGVCCAGAGTYSLLRPADARRIAEPKLDEAEAAGLDFLVTVNPVCQREVGAGLRRRHSRIRVLHLAELLAMAKGGGAHR
jgi:glycolate oxidase iron-sulfur subunit